MYEFMKMTAWGMEKPQAYGPFHLTFMIVGLALCVLLAYLFRKASEKTNKIILLSCGIFLIVCEVYKQLFYTFYIGNGAYQWWIFPFQLCSVPMYLCVIAPLVKNKLIQEALYRFLATYNLLGGFVALFEPSGLSHEYVTLTLHAFIWHIMLVFVGFYLIASKRAGTTLKEFLSAILVFLCLWLLAQVFNIAFGNHDLNMFYISPVAKTPLAVFKDFEATLGRGANIAIYTFALTLGAFLFYLINLGILKLRKKHEAKKQAIEQISENPQSEEQAPISQ